MLRKIHYLFLITLIISPTFKLNAQQFYKDVEQSFYATSKLRGKSAPMSLNWINGGKQYSYTEQNSKTGHEEIRSFDPSNMKDELILDAEGLSFPNSQSQFEYKSFEWGRDSRHLLFQSNFRKIYRRSGISDYYIYSIKDKTLKLAADNARTAELSPDGSMIGYERDGNIYMYDFAEKKETQLTTDAGGNIFNGHYDWVYEEEFGKAQAWNWSPDSKYIAYWQFDETGVPVVKLTDFEGLHPQYEDIPIPQVGDKNPKVRIGVIDVKNNTKKWLTPDDSEDYYIPRVYWTSKPNTLAMIVMNRAQNKLELYLFNVATGEHKLIMTENSQTWISIFNFYTDVDDMMYFPQNINEYFWISDRSGWYQIYRYNYNGNLLNRVTDGNWDVNKIVGINTKSKRVYYTSAEATPLEENLYSVKFDGKDKKRLTSVPGNHSINMAPNTEFYIDSYSNTRLPEQVELWKTGNKMLKKIQDNKSVKEYIKQYAYSPKELFSFVTSDSVRLDCSMIKPFNFDSTKKYPVILSIYGGPESHSVYNSFEISGWNEYLAQNGYIIVDVNNRGSADYGRAFEKIVYKQLGKWESRDFTETARYLSSLPYVDSSRMAIMGTSYGGYSTIYTMLTHPGVFKLGIANSPVTDWRLYDDIYTERYMGLLSDNEQGYVKSAAMPYARNLTGKLLLIHSLMDDNVHVANTMQLLTALTNAGKDADLRIYPPGAHGAYYSKDSYILIEEVYLHYLSRFLKGDCTEPEINSTNK